MQDIHATYFGARESGIPVIAELPWGSHFCQFYQGREDLLEILVPYLRAGLQNNELCLWVVDGPQDVEEAGQALTRAVPRFEEYARQGQVEILSRDQWRSCDGQLVSAVVSRLDQAISRGFDGLRLACNALPEETHAPGAHDTADALCQYNVIAAFAYPRDRFDAAGLMALVKNHRLALVKNAGRWEVIESAEAQSMKQALRRNEEKLHSVFANMSEGYAYHRIVLDQWGDPCDYVFLEVNESFERLTSLRREDLLGRRATQVLPGIEKDPADWIGTYGRVALSGTPVQFENYSQSLRKWYSVSAFSPHKGFFAVTFSDITERKATEQALREANERLQKQAEELHAQAEELHAQAEELQASNEELREQEQALRESEERHRHRAAQPRGAAAARQWHALPYSRLQPAGTAAASFQRHHPRGGLAARAVAAGRPAGRSNPQLHDRKTLSPQGRPQRLGPGHLFTGPGGRAVPHLDHRRHY
jgi:PAS domain-containing protein